MKLHARSLLALLSLLGTTALAEVPQQLTVQGRLSNLAGEGVDGFYALTVVLYAEPDRSACAMCCKP